MNYRAYIGYNEVTLCVRCKVRTPCNVRLKVYDEDQANTVFTNRYSKVAGDGIFFVRMPLAPKIAVVSIYCDATGNLPAGSETNLYDVTIEKQPLQKKLDVLDFTKGNLREFVLFAQRFCYNAGILKPDTYVSHGGNFEIEYVKGIMAANGKELRTPARINKHTGIMQCSQRFFVPYTVPMRMAIVCHEYAHFNMNEQMENEVEADLNGLLIYLGLGFPRIEAYDAFLEVFKGTPTQQNKQRYDIINKFIRDFEKQNMYLYE